MEQFNIRADKKRNSLYCVLKGYFLESEIELALDRISDEISNLTSRYDVILDIQDLKTSPEYMKRVFYEKLIRIIQSDCRFIFDVNPDKNFNPFKKSGKSALNNHVKIRVISRVQEAEDFLEQDFLLKNLFYN